MWSYTDKRFSNSSKGSKDKVATSHFLFIFIFAALVFFFNPETDTLISEDNFSISSFLPNINADKRNIYSLESRNENVK